MSAPMSESILGRLAPDYEHRTQPLLTRAAWRARVAGTLVLAFGVLGAGLGLGILGYHYLGQLAWVDATLNAAMILAGMGPVDVLPDAAAKLFASAYALFSGLVFIGTAGILIAPFAHRLLHIVHLEAEDQD